MSFVDDGYTIIRGAYDRNLLAKIHQTINDSLGSQSGLPSNNDAFSSFTAHFDELRKTKSPYEILKPVWKSLMQADLIAEIFLQPKLFNEITRILGRDLCFEDGSSLTVNIPGLSDPRSNYLFKGYHQEVWSGASISTIQFWTPLFQRSTKGQIVLAKGTHAWGHVPHMNREPIDVPIPLEPLEIETDLDYGDVIIFHTLLLHRSVPIEHDGAHRLALPCLIRSFLTRDESFEQLKNWKIFSYSDMSLIKRKLGNHYLSPYRLIDLPNQKFTGGVL